MTEITVAAEILRDEVELYDVGQVRYIDGKLEVPVGWWAWRRLREIATRDIVEAGQQPTTAAGTPLHFVDGIGLVEG